MPTVSESWPLAQKDYLCTSCTEPIPRGVRYHRWTGRGDMWDGLATARECAECCERYGRPIPEPAPKQPPDETMWRHVHTGHGNSDLPPDDFAAGLGEKRSP